MTHSDTSAAATIASLKQPPWSREAEQAVIGGALIANDRIADLQAEGFCAEYFYWPGHRAIWAAIDSMISQNIPVDIITITERMDAKDLEHIGGLAYLADVARNTPSASNIDAYARIVRERYVQRKWLHCAQQIASVIYDPSGLDHEQRMDAIDSLITAMGEDQRQCTRWTIKESLSTVVEAIQFKHENPGIHGLCTGFRHLDHRINGMLPGDLVVIAGRPAMGKTTVMTAMARNAAKAGKRGIIFSLEMPHASLATRMIAAEGSVKLGLLKSAKVLDFADQCERLAGGISKLKDLPIVFDDQGGLSVQEIAARTRREHRQQKIDWIIVDHIGLVDSRRHKDRDDLNIADVTRTLKRLAKELGIVVIALSQVNRKCEERSNKRPRMSDLLGSSAIEQDADIVITLYRDSVYNENCATPNQLELISAKLRDGEAGSDFVEWRGEYNQVMDWPEGAAPVPSVAGKTKNGYEG
jgi:replicative DNA helicase